MNYNIKFDPDEIIKLSKKVTNRDTLENIKNYNDEMTISQVVRFFERQGIEFTKTMIQNYVRVNVMPPPIDKRYYVKDHLILLTLINNLKSIYSLDDIKRLMRPVLKDINTFDDDMINMTAIYDIYIKLYQSALDDWENQLPELMNKVQSLIDANGQVKENEKDTVYYFMTILTLMAQSIATKQLAKELIDQFSRTEDESE